jgi:hypothetical protein
MRLHGKTSNPSSPNGGSATKGMKMMLEVSSVHLILVQGTALGRSKSQSVKSWCILAANRDGVKSRNDRNQTHDCTAVLEVSFRRTRRFGRKAY